MIHLAVRNAPPPLREGPLWCIGITNDGDDTIVTEWGEIRVDHAFLHALFSFPVDFALFFRHPVTTEDFDAWRKAHPKAPLLTIDGLFGAIAFRGPAVLAIERSIALAISVETATAGEA